MSFLQWFSAFNQNTICGANTSANHNSGGCGQAKCTWTRYAQDSDCELECMFKHRLGKCTTSILRSF